MRVLVWGLIFPLALLLGRTSAAGAQRVHEIKLEAKPDKEVYRFSPAEVSAKPGDVLSFRVESGPPHSIVFEAAGLSEAGKEALNGAMSRRVADLSSPLLTTEGAEYKMVVPQLPPGRYVFFCLPHRAYDEPGQLVITK